MTEFPTLDIVLPGALKGAGDAAFWKDGRIKYFRGPSLPTTL